VFKHLNSVTPKKYRWNSFLENLTPIPARKLKMKQTYDLSEKVVVMELEQLSMNDVQQSIEERQNKMLGAMEKKGRKKVLKHQSSCKQTKSKEWNNTRIAKKYR